MLKAVSGNMNAFQALPHKSRTFPIYHFFSNILRDSNNKLPSLITFEC